MDLYSINYVHTGKPKFWYAVPPNSGMRTRVACKTLFMSKTHGCRFPQHANWSVQHRPCFPRSITRAVRSESRAFGCGWQAEAAL